MNLDHTDLLAVGVQIIDDLLGHVADRAHGDNDAVGVGSAIVVEQLVISAQLLVDLVHILLNDGGQSLIELVAGLAVLEEDISVFVRAAGVGPLRVESVLAERGNGVHVAHILKVFIIPYGDLLDLVGGTEPVKEVDEGYAALDGSQMCHGRQVHDLLGIILAQHGKTGLPAGHHIGVVAENVQRMGGNGTGRNVEHAGQQLAGDLVHIGDHQQQALGRGISGGQRACGQRAVHGAGRARLGLHLAHLYRGAEDVFLASGRPLVNQVCHGRGRGDRINPRHFGKRVADVCSGVITVHGLELSCHKLTS